PRLEATYHFLRRVVVRRELLAAPIAPSLELALDRPLLKRLSVPVVVPHRRQASASSWLRASPPPPLLAVSRSPCCATSPGWYARASPPSRSERIWRACATSHACPSGNPRGSTPHTYA